MTSAQLEPRPEFTEEHPEPALFALQDPQILKEQVAARLAAHRARRQKNAPAAPAPTLVATPTRARTARIAATVAERYAHSESYRSFLATEAETAIHQAEAAAHVAAVNALAVTAAQLDLLEVLDEIAAAEPPQPHPTPRTKSEAKTLATPQPPQNQQAVASNHLTVRLYEESVATPAASQPLTTSHARPVTSPQDEQALDEEIAFRQSPTFEDPIATTEIPANLLEFPRQLIAARRARPRLAEGPLRDEDGVEQDSSQLRIFEVEPTQLSSAPAMASSAPEWTSIMLDAHPVGHHLRPASTLVHAIEPEYFTPVTQTLLQTASLELRIMAAAVDSCIVLAAMLAFATAAVLTIGAPPSFQFTFISDLVATNQLAAPLAFIAQALPMALIAGTAFLVLSTLYQLLFFTFSNTTPGMTYARIGLCTFSDENPTRPQMRRRALAFLLSASPLGLGLLWSWIDSDRLGWHDRLSRMYQRSY